MKINLLFKQSHFFLALVLIFLLSPLSEASRPAQTHAFQTSSLLTSELASEFLKADFQSQTQNLCEKKEITLKTSLPFDTLYENDPEMEKGLEKTLVEGQNGTLSQTFLLEIYNGNEVNRELINETVTPPQHKVIAEGTKIIFRNLDTPFGTLTYSEKMQVYATPYTAISAGGSGYTATGTLARYGTIAVDPTVIPLGTKLYIPGYGLGTAEDTGGAIKGNMIDLFYDSNHGWWNSSYVEIYILSN